MGSDILNKSDHHRGGTGDSIQTLVDFLRADLELGFTFAKLAKTEKEIGDPQGFQQARQNAVKTVETARNLEGRLPPSETSEAIKARRAELERILSTL
jgi:hypothetical protein